MDAERLPFAENLVFYRKQKKMLQRELAQKLDVSMQAVSSWENGTNSPRLHTLYQICSVLEISVADLLGCKAESVDNCSDFERKLIDSYRKHPELHKAICLLLGLEP